MALRIAHKPPHFLHCDFLQPLLSSMTSKPHLHAVGLIMLTGHGTILPPSAICGVVFFGGAVFTPSRTGLHFPECLTSASAHFAKHGLSYVWPSAPHTGSSTSGHTHVGFGVPLGSTHLHWKKTTAFPVRTLFAGQMYAYGRESITLRLGLHQDSRSRFKICQPIKIFTPGRKFFGSTSQTSQLPVPQITSWEFWCKSSLT